MENTSWLEENVYKRVGRGRKAMIKLLVIFLVVPIFLSVLFLVLNSADWESKKYTVRIFALVPFWGFIFSMPTIVLASKSRCEKKIKKAMEGLGTVRDLEEDMKDAKGVGRLNTTTIGSKYIFVMHGGIGSVRIIKYDEMASIKLIDSRYKSRKLGNSGIEIQLNSAEGKEIGRIYTVSKEEAIGIVEELERRLSVGKQESNEAESFPIRDQVVKKLNTKDKKIGIMMLALGAIMLVAATAGFFVNYAKIPTDYRYRGSVQVKADKVESNRSSYYIHYMDSTSAATFREKVSSEEYYSVWMHGATVYREKYSSDIARKSVFLKEGELSAKEVRNKLCFVEIDLIVVGWFLGALVAIVGVVFVVIGTGRRQDKKIGNIREQLKMSSVLKSEE